MDLLHSIRRDLFYKFVGELTSRTGFLAFTFYLARKLGVAEFGAFNLSISTAFVVGIVLLDPGLNNAIVQRIVSTPGCASEDSGAVFLYKVGLIPVLLLALCLIKLWFGTRLPSTMVLVLAGLYVASYAIFEYLCYITNGYHRMDADSGLRIFNRVLVTLFGIGAAQSGSVSAVLVWMAIANISSVIVAWFIVARKCVVVVPKWNCFALRRIVLLGLPIAGVLMLNAIYLKWDLFLLSVFSINTEQIGWYAGAYKIVEALSAIPSIFAAAVFPTLVLLRTQQSPKFDKLLLATVKAVLLISIPVAVLLNAFSERLVVMLFGPKYSPASAVLRILIWCIVPMFVSFYLLWVNVATGQSRRNIFFGLAALITGFVVDATLIPRWGFTGAAWGALAANCTFAVCCIYCLHHLLPKLKVPFIVLRWLACGLLMAIAVHFFGKDVTLSVGASIIVYGLSLILLGGIGPEDLSLTLNMLRPKPSAS